MGGYELASVDQEYVVFDSDVRHTPNVGWRTPHPVVGGLRERTR